MTTAPRVMSEWFLKEYMAADVVVGRELQVVQIGHGCYFTGLLCGLAGPDMRQKALREVLGPDAAMADVSVVGTSNPVNHIFIPYCKVTTCVLVFYSSSFVFMSRAFFFR